MNKQWIKINQKDQDEAYKLWKYHSIIIIPMSTALNHLQLEMSKKEKNKVREQEN